MGDGLHGRLGAAGDGFGAKGCLLGNASKRIEVIEKEAADFAQKNSSKEKEWAAAVKDAIAPLEARRLRLLAYLQVKVFLADRDGSLLIQTVTLGQADALACLSGRRAPSFMGCLRECLDRNPTAPDNVERCTDACPGAPSCLPTKKCEQDFLPF
jgi:hypothetical protein